MNRYGFQNGSRGGGWRGRSRRPQSSTRLLRRWRKLARRRITAIGAGSALLGIAVVLVAYDLASFAASSELRMAFDCWHALLGSASELHSSSDTGAANATHRRIVLLDCRGCVIGVLGASESVRLADESEWLSKAVVAKEDKRFFKHLGLDAIGLVRALLTLGRRGGGSTLTQQLVKNEVLYSTSRSVSRKLAELILSCGLERRLSKEQLLSLYLSRSYFGHGLYGATAASWSIFNKHPSSLDIEESALLAATLPTPELKSPFCNPNGALNARNDVLANMARCGYISNDQMHEARAASLPKSIGAQTKSVIQHRQRFLARRDGELDVEPLAPCAPYRAPHFVDEAMRELRKVMKNTEMPHQYGLEVSTTLDLELQERAEDALRSKSRSPDDSQAAFVALDPSTGAVRALVGSENYAKSPFNRGFLSSRAAGSVMKPIVYLAALADGVVTPSTRISDEPPERTIKPMDPSFRDDGLKNDSKAFRSDVSVHDCLKDSLNVPTMKLGDIVGIEAVQSMARRLGLTSSKLPNALSLTLGSCNVTPFELACAYGTFAAKGVRMEPHFIASMRRPGAGLLGTRKVLYKTKPIGTRVVPSNSCSQLTQMLQAAAVQGSGHSTFGNTEKVIGMVGTSDDNRDCWFAGWTPSLASVVWVGRDDNRSLGKQYTGASVSAPLWSQIMLGRDESYSGDVTRAELRRNPTQPKRKRSPVGRRRIGG